MPPAAALHLDDPRVRRCVRRRLRSWVWLPVVILVAAAGLLSVVEVRETETRQWVRRGLLGERRGQSIETDRFVLTTPLRLDLRIQPGLLELLAGPEETLRTTYNHTFGCRIGADSLASALYWIVPVMWAGMGVPALASNPVEKASRWGILQGAEQ